MDRRTFVRAVAGAVLISPLATEAQQAEKVRRIGYLSFNSAEIVQPLLVAFRQGLRERGWVEGRNIVIETRFADGKADRLPALITELVRLNVDIIVTTSSATTWAAKDAAKAIPIVMAASTDAPGEGLITSLAHPGGNITGITMVGPEIAGKQLQLLKDVVPAASRLAVLTNPTNRAHVAGTRELTAAARSLGAQLQVLEASNPDQLDSAFAAMTSGGATAFLVLTDAMFLGQRHRVADLAASNRLPGMYFRREFVDAGGLISYGSSLVDMFRRSATYVDKILKGARPADLPVEQPTKFELVINLKTAKALGLTIPQSVLVRADEVIE